MKKIIIYIFIGLIIFILGYVTNFIVHKSSINDRDEVIEVKTDTIYIDKVKTVVEPIYISKRTVDTLYIRDTVLDSIIVVLPIEQKIYQDTNYRAVISGYRPNLDTLNIYTNERVINNTVTVTKQKHFGFGITAGYGVYYGFERQSIDSGFGIMAGLTYTF